MELKQSDNTCKQLWKGPDLHEWVTGGEFVLTTWYAFSKSPDLQEDGFKKLAPRISAIGIKQVVLSIRSR